jgi:FeS assembly SUF system protein
MELKEIKELEAKAYEALRTVYDPEMPINIVELGLIYDVSITAEGEVVVLMTLTAPNCPEAEAIPVEAQQALKSIEGVKDAKVLLTFDPPWDKSRLSDEAKLALGLF